MKNSQIKTRRFNVALVTLSLLFAFHNSVAAGSFNPAYTGRPTATGPIENGAIDVSGGNEVAYRTMYFRGLWAGDIEARIINRNGSIDSSRELAGWESPASRLEKMDWDKDRIIFTSNGSTNVPFRWNELSEQQRNELGGANTGNQVLQYIRGQRTNESPNGANFRPRESLLGDIVHSNLYVWKHSTAPNSPTLLYVGANDGMLHVFNAATGREVFSYIPSPVIGNLKTLTNTEYKHQYFVDGQISIARVLKTQAETQPQNIRTVLVGTLGRGGAGVYALDVTNPIRNTESDAAKMLMWEITQNAEFRNLGEVHGTAQITRLADDTPVAIFGNGFNPKGTGKSTLYAVNLFTGKKVLDIEVGDGTPSAPSGLATPTPYDLDVNGKADLAYAGDTKGNLWKFDLTKKTATKLFTTEGKAPITTPPTITPHPNGGLMVVFGTGELSREKDAELKQKNAVYGIWDGAPKQNSKLLEQSFDNVQTLNSKSFRTISSGQPIWKAGNNNHYGWKVDLPEGERMVGEEPTQYAGRFYLVTTNPTTEFRKNWLNELDMITGSSQKCPAFDLDGDGIYCTSNGTPDTGDLMPNNKPPVSQELDAGVISQPRLIKVQSNLATTLYNWNDNREIIIDPPKEPPPNPPPTGGGGPGVSGGHFDYDSFVNSGGFFENTKHVHEYDDKYRVTGVNMLDPSESKFRLNLIVGSATRKFKILLLNQYLNPAVAVSIGGYDFESVKTYGGLAGNINSNELKNGKPQVSTA
ncbi:MAG: pilus assembly protein, partial [Limnobacter sp.]